MLVLSRKKSETIKLGNSIEITVVRVNGDQVQAGDSSTVGRSRATPGVDQHRTPRFRLTPDRCQRSSGVRSMTAWQRSAMTRWIVRPFDELEVIEHKIKGTQIVGCPACVGKRGWPLEAAAEGAICPTREVGQHRSGRCSPLGLRCARADRPIRLAVAGPRSWRPNPPVHRSLRIHPGERG